MKYILSHVLQVYIIPGTKTMVLDYLSKQIVFNVLDWPSMGDTNPFAWSTTSRDETRKESANLLTGDDLLYILYKLIQHTQSDKLLIQDSAMGLSRVIVASQ
jgi:hypothetical protein